MHLNSLIIRLSPIVRDAKLENGHLPSLAMLT